MKLSYITTTFPNNQKTVFQEERAFRSDPGIENEAINLYPDVEFEVFEGFGGAFTDSAGYVYAHMKQADQEEMIATYYDSDKMNYCLGRMHIDSCDFSTGQYEAMPDQNDREMHSFSLADTEKYILPLIKDVEKMSGKVIDIMISPWSPPTFMKSNKQRIQGGKLLPEYRDFWADYICKYILELKKRGIRVNRMSLQNEPAAVQTWDSCIYTAEEEKEFLKEHMYPALIKNELQDIEIFIWDHNKERIYERACTIIDDTTTHMIAGLAFHWYSGDHFEALELVRNKFPDKKLILSETCIEYSKFSAEDYLANAQKYAHDMIGNLNAGMTAFYDWNLILDENGGPNHVDNFCDAPYLYDMKNHQLMERNTLTYIWHFSHFIKPGAVRMGYSKFTSRLDVTAFKNPDGSLLSIILNEQKDDQKIVVRINGEVTEIILKAESITTIVIDAEE